MNYKLFKKNFLWFGLSSCATTLFSCIFMPEKYFNGEMGETRKAALLLHEVTHVRQWQNYGFWYCLSWIFSTSRRRKWEMEAYRTQILYVFRQEGSVDIDAWCKMITELYGIFGFISYNECKKEIEDWLKIE